MAVIDPELEVVAGAIAALPRRADPVVVRIRSLNRLNDQSQQENR
jgi:hypothetical protein